MIAPRTKLLLGATAIVTAGSLLLLTQLDGSAKADAPSAAPRRSSTPADEPRTSTASAPIASPQLDAPSPIAPATDRGVALLAKVRTGAPTSAPWTERVKTVIAPLRALPKARLGELDCRSDGCVLDVEYPDELAQELGDEALTESEAFRGYDGWRHRSVRHDDSGRVIATWFFMKP